MYISFGFFKGTWYGAFPECLMKKNQKTWILCQHYNSLALCKTCLPFLGLLFLTLELGGFGKSHQVHFSCKNPCTFLPVFFASVEYISLLETVFHFSTFPSILAKVISLIWKKLFHLLSAKVLLPYLSSLFLRSLLTDLNRVISRFMFHVDVCFVNLTFSLCLKLLEV